MKKSLVLAFAALLMLTAAVPDKTTTIFIIGDSTAANKDISGGKQERGWGMALQCYFQWAFLALVHPRRPLGQGVGTPQARRLCHHSVWP